MSQSNYSAEAVSLAARESLAEVFGEGSPAIDILTTKMVGNLILQGDGIIEPTNPERYALDKPPRYTERVLSATSTEDVLEIAQEAATRLSCSIASYLDNNNPRKKHNPDMAVPGKESLRPWIFPEGAHSGEGPLLGDMIFEVQPLAKTSDDLSYDFESSVKFQDIVKLQLRGGEHAPFDYLDEVRACYPRFEQHFYLRQAFIKNPMTGEEHSVIYPTSWTGYLTANGSNRLHGSLHGRGEVIGTSKTTDVMVNAFWALDTAITYYENVYQAGYKVAELPYVGWRDAGCLDENDRVDYNKAKEYLNSLTGEDETNWPKVGDYDSTVLVMDEGYRASIDARKRNFSHI